MAARSTDWPLKCRSEPVTVRHQGDRKGPFGQPERHQGGKKGLVGPLARHQGGRKGSIGQPARHQGGRKEPFGQPGRHQGGRTGSIGGRKGSIGQPARHQEAGKNHLHRLGGTREAPGRLVARLPIESRFWKGAGFCIILTQFQWRLARFAANPGVGSTVGCP